jgi:type VI secretion system protein ImpC
MSATQTNTKPEAAAEAEAGISLLDQVVAATRQTAPDRAQELVKTLVSEALSGTVTFDRNVSRSIDRAIAAIDAKISAQLNAVMHSERFLKLEGSWRGLHHLVMNSETGTSLKIRVLNASKRDLTRDLTRAVEFDQSQLFKKIYENEFGTPGGEPYGALIGDYEWTAHPEDVETLRLISNVAAGGFAPFISAAGAGMFGFRDWTELSKPRDLAKIFESQEYTKWRSFRETEDARFVSLVMPRVIARLPYGAATVPVEEFAYEETPREDGDAQRPMQHQPDGRLCQDRLLRRHPWRRGRRQDREPAGACLYVR